MRMHSEESNTRRIDTSNDKISTDMSLVLEEMLFQHRHTGDHSGLSACREGMQFEVRGDEGGGEFGICCCAGAGTPYLGRDIMEFFAVLFG